jgi:hypothetical protein
MGESEYSKLVNELGEDGLIRQLLLTIPSLGERIEENRRHLKATKVQTVERSRTSSAKAGAITGILSGAAFLAFAWLLHLIWKVPYWNSMATLVDGVLPLFIIASLIYWRAAKTKIKFTYKPILVNYIVIVTIGSIIGASRWGAGSQWSAKVWITFLWRGYEKFDTIVTVAFMILVAILWLIVKIIQREPSL